MKCSISLNFKYFINGNELRKKSLPIENSVHTTEYFALGKALLATLYLKVKVYLTNLLNVYSF